MKGNDLLATGGSSLRARDELQSQHETAFKTHFSTV